MEIYEYNGFWNCKAKCGIDIEKKKDHCVVMLTELDDNTGTSITNAYEQLATEIYNAKLKSEYTPQQILWVEHYPDRGHSGGSPMFEESFAEVTMRWDGHKFSTPQWIHIRPNEIKNLIQLH